MVSQSPALLCLEFFASTFNRFCFRLRHGFCLAGVAMLAVVCLAGGPLAAQSAFFGQPIGSGYSNPVAVAVDGSGNVYVADPGNIVVYKFAPDGNGGYTQLANVADSSVLNTPTGVAVDGSGNVYIVDNGNDAVYKFAPNGSGGYSQLANVAGSPALVYPTGVAVDGSGNVYILDQNQRAVHKFTPNGSGGYTQLADVVGSSVLDVPNDVAVDGSGNVYVVDQDDYADAGDTGHDGVYKFAPNGSGGYIRLADVTDIARPNNVAVDSNGNVYVSNANYEAISKFAPNGSGGYTQLANVAESPVLRNPQGVAVDGSGGVYVADSGDSQVLKLQTAGVSFGSVAVGSSTPPTQTLTFTIYSAGAIAAPQVLTQGAAGLDFTDAGTGTCTTTNGAGHPYSANATCTVVVKFAPQYAGARFGAVNLTNTSGTVIATAYVYGTGTGPQVAFNPGTSSGTLGGGFNNPVNVALDASGNVYVADFGNNAVKEIPVSCISGTNDASCVLMLGGGFSEPAGMAIDGNGNVYITEYSTNLVKEIPSSCIHGANDAGCVLTLGGGFNTPIALAVDGSGNIYVADSRNNAPIYTMSNTCTSSSCVVALGGGFDGPNGLAVDGNGNVYVDSAYSNEVEEMSNSCTSSGCVTKLNAGFNTPLSLAVDGAGNLYVTDHTGTVLNEAPAGCTSSGCLTTLSGSYGNSQGVALDGNGNVYISDTANNVVKKVSRTAASLTFPTTTAVGTTDTTDGTLSATLQNIGNQPLVFTVPGSGNNPSISADFTLATGAGACPVISSSGSTQMLAAGSSCTLGAGFAPLTAGTLSEQLVVTDNALNASSPGYASQTIALNGVGLQATQLIAYQGETADFAVTPFKPVAGSGGVGALTYSVTPTLPPGIAMSSSTGSITGLPTNTTGRGTYTVTVTDSTNATATATFDLSINGPVTASQAIVSIGLTQNYTSAPFTPVVGGGGTTPYSYSIAPGLPTGLSMDSVTGTISGKPTLASASASYNVTVTDQNGATATDSFSLVVNPPPTATQAIASVLLPASSAVTAFTPVTGGGGTVPLSFSVSPSLPTALSMDSTTGTITGTTTASSSTGNYTVTVTDYNGATAMQSFSLAILPQYYAMPSTAVGSTSATQTVTLYVASAGTLGSIHVSAQGAVNADYKFVSGGSCAVSTAYALADTCTIDVAFAPRFSGTRYGAVQLLDGSGNVLATAYLSGMGTGPQVGFAPTGATTLTSGLNGPIGMAVDGNGNLFVADRNDNTVKEILAAGGYTTVNNLGGSFAFNAPYGLALDGAGNLFVADSGNGAVEELLASNGYSTVTAIGNNTVRDPVGVAVDPNGNVFVDDFSAMREILAAGGYTTVNTLGVSGFVEPYGIAVDANSNVFVADTYNNAVEEISAASGYTTKTPIGSGLSLPFSVYVDGNGNVFVDDAGSGTVKEILAVGGYTTVNTLGGSFSQPYGIAVDGAGNVYTTDAGTSEIDELIVATAPSVNFATLTTVGSQDTADGTQTVTVENIGNATLSFSVPGSGNNPSFPNGFLYDSGSTCTQLNSSSGSPYMLAVNANCSLGIDFKPTVSGLSSDNVVLTDNSLNGTNVTQNIAVSGTAKATPTVSGTTVTQTYGTATSSTVTVAGGSGTATGSITYSIDGDTGVTMSLSGGQYVVPIAATLSAGSHTLAVSYSGDSNYNPATSATVETWTTAKAAVQGVAGTTVVQTYGTATSSTITVTGVSGGTTPTGSITYSIDGGTGVTVSLSGGQYAVPIAAALGGGSHTLAVSYSGDGNYSAASSATVESWTTAKLGVQSVAGTTVVQTYGTATSSTVTVTGTSGGATPTGSITYSIDGGTGVTVSLSSGQYAVPIAAALGGGSHTLEVSYSGDSNYSAANSATLESWTTAKVAVQGVAGTSVTQTYGIAASSTVTVMGVSGGATPTGSITYSIDGGTGITVSLSGGQYAVPIAAALGGGNHTLAASYSGDGNYSAANSATLEGWTTAKAASSVAVVQTAPSAGTALAVNTGITLTATVSDATTLSTGAPSGTVQFLDGTTSLGTVTLSGGVASFTAIFLSTGTHVITAVYSGDANFTGITSPALNESVTIPPGYTISANPASLTITNGTAGSSLITVTPIAGYQGTMSFACSQLPAHSICQFGPSTLVFTGGSAAQSSELTVITDWSGPPSSLRTRGTARMAGIFWLPGGLLALFVLLRRRSLPTRVRLLSVLAVLALGAAGMSGCGSSPVTPAGTSSATLTVTATAAPGSNSSNSTQTLTITVNIAN